MILMCVDDLMLYWDYPSYEHIKLGGAHNTR